MRFAITAVDRNLGIFDALIQAGWEPVKLFTVRTDHRIDFTENVVRLAEQRRIPIQLSQMVENDLMALKSLDCDAIICGSYKWRIPDWRPYLKFGLNFHPSPLPFGRGPKPPVRAILDNWASWAVTCHQLTPKFDDGDILACEPFCLGDDETYESLDLKLQLAGRRLAFKVASDFESLWAGAKAQGQGDYWKLWTEEDRRIDFSQRVAQVLRQIRAFGPHECIATLRGSSILVRRAVGWREPHAHPVGALVHATHDQLVVAVDDGYIGLTEWRENVQLTFTNANPPRDRAALATAP